MAAEYLIAMKLMSGRRFKNDLSDIIGILREHQLRGTPIFWKQIDNAVNRLYGGWSDIPPDSQDFIRAIMTNDDLNALYEAYRREEQADKGILIDFQKNYSNVLSKKNADDILNILKKKKK